VFFSSEVGDSKLASRYYRISDSDVLKKTLGFRYKQGAGEELTLCGERNRSEKYRDKTRLLMWVRRFELGRLARELVWKVAPINYHFLDRWVKAFNPNIVFFCAGDSIFAYRIYQNICESVPSARKVLYVTDDYILPRRSVNLFWWIRRYLILGKMKCAVAHSDVFITISPEMRNEYKRRLGRDSINILNISESLKIESFEKDHRCDLVLVYAGGLHFDRWKTLRSLALAIKDFNHVYNRNVRLKIYSHQDLGKKVRRALEVSGASQFCGSLNPNGVRKELNNADILVHVESFNRKCIEGTRLSISTKIPEYISVGGRILAIGPSCVSSMKMLLENAYCITELSNIYQGISKMFNNDQLGRIGSAFKEEFSRSSAIFEKVVFDAEI